jgi:RNA polymerase sigma factor (sigma-70 family)
MVLRVCRRVLQDGHAAEDAFQATFLILVRKAASLRRRELVGNWLYGVAYRVAARARVEAARRRDRERRTEPPPPGDPLAELSGRELATVLDEELNRLAEKYRAPLVLCYLQGLTRDEAAQQLGWSLGTFKRRLEQARDRLHGRLARRGLTLSVGLLATVLSGNATAAPPLALVSATVRAALAGPTAAGAVSGPVASLVEGVLRIMFLTKLRTAAALLLAAVITLAGVGLLARQALLAEAPEAQADGPPQPPAEPLPEGLGTRPMAGTVVDATGNAVPGANVWLVTKNVARGDVEILKWAKSDPQGRFQVIIPGRWFATVSAARQELGLIAHKPGLQLAAVGYYRSSIPPDTGTRLVLGPPAEASFRVLTPDGKPLGGARVELTAVVGEEIHTDITEERARDLAAQFKSEVRATPLGFAPRLGLVPVPEELGRLLAAQTDDQGNVTVQGLPRGDVGGLTISAPAYGTQTVSRDGNPPRGSEYPQVIRLRSVGRLAGRLVAKTPEAVRGISVRVGSLEADAGPGASLYRSGLATVQAGADGRFEVPALAEGQLIVQVVFPKGAPFRAREPGWREVTLRADKRTDLEIPVESAVRVKGVVREKGSGKPVAGAALLLFHGQGNTAEEVVTDAAGRYECLVLPGEVSLIPGTPKGYVPAPRDGRSGQPPTKVPAGARERELPAIELIPAATLRGTVVDDAGKPVAGAVVRVMGMVETHRYGYLDLMDRTVTTDARGEFAFEEMDPRVEMRLKATHKGAFTAAAVMVHPATDRPVRLHVSPTHAAKVAGRLVDAAGRPAAGVKVEIWHRPWMPPPNLGTPHKVTFAGKAEIRSDADGKFQTPPELEPDGEYRVVAEAAGFRTEQSPWQAAGGKATLAWSDLVVPRMRSATGRVRDREGQPVAGARVLYVDDRNRTRATTDSDGRFQLSSPLAGPGFLLVEKAGYRFQGQQTAPAADALDVMLPRSSEPAGKVLKTLPAVLGKKERQALAARVLEPLLKRALDGKDESLKTRSLEVLARIDPGRVLELIEKKPDKEPWFDDYLRRAVAQALAAESLDEARAVVEAMRDPGFRATGYIDLCDALSAAKRAQKLEFLGQSLLHARNIQDAAHRVVHLTPVAKRLRALGEVERADRILREGQTAARELPTEAWAGYARGAFADELAVIDLPAALALTKDLKDAYEYDRHHGNIAHKLGGKNPAEAERVLQMLRHPNQPTLRDQWALCVCYRMAPVDLERAKRIADRIGGLHHKAYAYGVMAQAQAGSKPAVATELLDKAFALLQAHVEAGKDNFNGFWAAPSVAGCLLPVAEQINPQLVAEFFWRALSFRSPPAGEEEAASQALFGDAALAMVLARYDRAMARPLMEVAAKRINKLAGRMEPLYTAAILIDPRWAVQLVEALPEGREKDHARLTVAGMLTREGEDFWRKVHSHLALWAPDTEDW